MDEPFVAKIWSELEKLGRVNAAERSVLLITFYGMLGDRENADYWVENSKKLHVPQVEINLARVLMLENLGFFTDSIEPTRFLSDPKNGHARAIIDATRANGTFQLVKSAFAKAKAMNIMDLKDLSPTVDATTRIMDIWGDSDLDYANALDFAGAVMRKRKLFMTQRGLIANPVEHPRDESIPYVKLSYEVDVDLETSMDMTSEYLELLSRSGKKIPQSMIFEFVPEHS